MQEGGGRVRLKHRAEGGPLKLSCCCLQGFLPFSGDDGFSFPPCLLPSESAPLSSVGAKAATVTMNLREATEVLGKCASPLPEHVRAAAWSPPPGEPTPTAAAPGRLRAGGGAPAAWTRRQRPPRRRPYLSTARPSQARPAAEFSGPGAKGRCEAPVQKLFRISRQ